jgi:hypothetical protein
LGRTRTFALRRWSPRSFGSDAREVFIECPIEAVLLKGLWMPHAAREFKDVTAVDMQANRRRIA